MTFSLEKDLFHTNDNQSQNSLICNSNKYINYLEINLRKLKIDPKINSKWIKDYFEV